MSSDDKNGSFDDRTMSIELGHSSRQDSFREDSSSTIGSGCESVQATVSNEKPLLPLLDSVNKVRWLDRTSLPYDVNGILNELWNETVSETNGHQLASN